MNKPMMAGLAAMALSWCFAGTEVNWTGGGSDTLMTTSENWASAVDVTDGSVKAAFATGGTAATAVGSTYLSGLGFNTAAAFTVDAADGASLGIGADGITTAGTGPYTISAPVEVRANQTWTIGQKLTIEGPIDSTASRTIRKMGTGNLRVTGGGNFAGDVYIDQGSVELSGENPFGSGAGKIYMAKDYSLVVDKAVVSKPVAVDPGGAWGSYANISVWAGNGPSTFREKVTFGDGNYNIAAYGNNNTIAKVTFEKGLEGSGYPYLRLNGGGASATGHSIVVFNGPVLATGRWFNLIPSGINKNGICAEVTFASTGNVMGALGHPSNIWYAGNVYTTVDWAFDNTSMTVYLGYNATWDLCGTQQRVGTLEFTHKQDRAPTVTNTSDKEATFSFTQGADKEFPGIFAGNLNVVKSGAKTLTITKAMTATGDFTVDQGCVAFTEDGSWANARSVVLANGTKVYIADGDTFGTSTEIKLTGTGSLSIPDGVTQTVGFLTIDDERQPCGKYTMGGGTLEVLYSGRVTPVDGKLVLADGERLTLDSHTLCDSFDTIILGAGAALDIQDPVFIDAAAEYGLELGADATLTLAEGIGIYAPGAKVGGVAVAPGRHTAETWLQGSGAVYVPYGPIAGTDVTWTDGGADSLMTTPENWSATVDLSGGTSRGIFATAGEEAIVTGSRFLNGLEFTSAGNFTVKAADADAELRLASGGIRVTGAKSYSVDPPVRIEGDQTWQCSGATLTVNGGLRSDPMARYTLHKTGSKELYLNGDGDFAGSVSIDEGGVIASGNDPFGTGASGSILVNDTYQIVCAGVTISKPITVDPAGHWGNKTGFSVWGDRAPSEIRGKVTATSGNAYTYIYSNGSNHGKLTFSGGIDFGDSYPYFNLGGGGDNGTGYSTLVITNNPMVSKRALYTIPTSPNKDGIAYRLVLAAAGNKMGSFGYVINGSANYHLRNCEIRTTVDWAFDDAVMPTYIDHDCTWDLCGTEQRIGFLDSYNTGGRVAVLTNSSEDPATLHFTQTADGTFLGTFAGNLSIDMSGAKKLTIDTPQTSTGGITVSGGTLEFTGNGSWRKSTALTVTGSGKVTVAKSRTFGRKSAVTLASADSLQLAAGVDQWVSKLTVGGIEYAVGDYTFGDGMLHVGTPGVVILVR